MGKLSISIGIYGTYNGSALNKAQKSLDNLALRTASANESISKSWIDSASKAEKAGSAMRDAGSRAAKAGDVMTASLTPALAAVGSSVGSAASSFESSMSRVEGALDDPKADMEELRQLALDMGKDTVFSATEAGAAMEELAKGGLTAADIKGGALATTMDLAAAGGLDLATAANTVVQSMGAFELGAERTGEAANALAGAAAASSADVSDLTQGLSQASAQANSAGWSIQDTTATLAAFADAGIKGSDAGTSLKTMLQRLSAPTDQAAALMDELGINVRDSQGNMLDAASIAGVLQTQLGKLDSATRDAAMQTLFGSDASRAALVMMNQGEQGMRRYTAATNDQEAAQRLANSQMGDTERAMEEMSGAIETASIQLGGALSPMAVDAANAVGDAADAFSGLDEGAQRAVAGLGLVAAAAGPVLSTSGRLAQGIGSMRVACGKARKDVAVYADALATTSAASLLAYQRNEKLAAALARNPLAKAAGGADKYVEALRAAAVATADYNSMSDKLKREQAKGTKANAELVASLSKEVEAKREVRDATAKTVAGYNQAAAAANASKVAVTAQAVAMKAAAVAGTALKGALAVCVPVAVISGIAALVDHFRRADEKARTLKAATEGLTTATQQGAQAAQAGAQALDGYGGSAETAKADIDGMLESQAQLASTISDANTSAAAQTAQLQDAYSAIQQYANRSDLTTEAQGRLKAAVETVNGMCGTQISVTDAANGKLADENGAISDVTASLGDYISKKVEQIRLDAQQQNLTALYDQQAKDIAELTRAQKAYNDEYGNMEQAASEYYNQMAAQGLPITMEQARATVEAGAANSQLAQDVKTAQSALDAVNTSIGNVSSSMGAQAAAANGANQSMQNMVLASPTVTAAINAIGGDVNDFAADLSNAGVSVETFRGLNADQLSKLVADWDGTGQSIVDSLDAMGVGMNDKGLSAATALANGMASGKINVDNATSVLKAAASGDWSGVASQMAAAGANLPQSVSDGITQNSFVASGATSQMLSAVALVLTGGDVAAAAQLLGGDIDEGLANGIMNGTLSEGQAAMLGEDVIAKAKESLESHSPSLAFYRIGGDVDAGLANGMRENGGDPLSAVGELGRSLVGAVSGLPGEIGSAGSKASAWMATGLGSNRGAVSSSASSLDGAAMGGVSGLSGRMGREGSSASGRFASGIGAGAGAAWSSAASVSNAAGSMSNVGNMYASGSHLSSNFASGIMSGVNWVWNAACSVAQAAKDALGFSVPKDGPWSGAEKGGMTSGLHLAQNFAAGMAQGVGAVNDSASMLAEAAFVEPRYGAAAPRWRASTGVDLSEQMQEMIDLLRVIADKEFNATIGVGAVSSALASSARVAARGRGLSV